MNICISIRIIINSLSIIVTLVKITNDEKNIYVPIKRGSRIHSSLWHRVWTGHAKKDRMVRKYVNPFSKGKKKKEKGWKDYPNPSATDWLAYANFLMTDQPEYTAETCDVMLRRVGIKMILINSNVRSPFFVAPRRLRLIYQYYTSRGKKTRDKSFICGSNRFESADEKLFESRDTQRSTFAIRTFINEN